MNEKTLLYGALTATAIAAGFGVYKGHETSSPRGHVQIIPVSRLDAAHVVQAVEVPVRLTSSDGSGLRLVSLEAAAAIEDPLALTELRLVFENPSDRILEGTFQITLPQGASVSRFAMKIGETWQEGEVVEKQQARAAYEDFLHRKQDPALMEQSGGNEFSARVFPIPARGKKEIILAYTEVLEAGAAYVLPLKGLPALAALDIDVHASGGAAVGASFGLHQQSFAPAQDFVVEARALPRSAGLRNGELLMARVVPFATSRPDPFDSAVVLVDTSASRSLGLAEQTSLLRRVFSKLRPDARVTVACFDQEVAPVYEGTVAGFDERAVKTILERGALGASDFQQALAWAGDEAKKKHARRILILGDGVATAGETDAQRIKLEVEKLRAAHVERIDAIAIGGIRDDAFLRTLVRGVLDRDGVVLDAAIGADGLARRLSEGTASGVPVKVEGATWSWPKTLDGLQAGDEVIVHAEVPPGTPVRIDVGGQQFSPDLRTTPRPLIERAWAQAKIQSLTEAPSEDAATTKKQIVALSTKHRVVSAHTAMLVLETDADYGRFGIDRTANANILEVRDGRIAVLRASRPPSAAPSASGWTDGDRQQANKQQAPITVDKPEERRNANGEEDDGKKRERQRTQDPWARPPPVYSSSVAPAPDVAPSIAVPPASEPATGKTALTTPTVAPPATATAKTVPVAPAPFVRMEPNKQPPAPKSLARPAPRPPAKTPTRADQEIKDGVDALKSAMGADESLDEKPASGRKSRPPLRDDDGPRDSKAPDSNAVTESVRLGRIVVDQGLSNGEAQRVLRAAVPSLRACYKLGLQESSSLQGELELSIVVNRTGAVEGVEQSAPGSSIRSDAASGCWLAVVRGLRFPAPVNGQARVMTTFHFAPSPAGDVAQQDADDRPAATPYGGRTKTVMDLLARGDKVAALGEATRWHAEEPADVMALVALGEALEANGDIRTAARAYGSILELYSFRADSRRFAGERLERLHDAAALRLAADSYGKAVAQRPDHPASHRLHAFALLKRGEHEKAFAAMRAGALRTYPSGRFLGADRILREDLGLIAAAWTRATPSRAREIHDKLREAGGHEETEPSLRFVLVWETDANDVDFHIRDARGGHAFYSRKELASGGELYEDVTTGYGPECFTIRGPRDRRAYPYTLSAHYYSRGPMGYGMGKLELIEHDGKGNLIFDERPFVVMSDDAYVDLGTVDRAAMQHASAMK